MDDEYLKLFSETLEGLQYKVETGHSIIKFRKNLTFYNYKGYFDLKSNTLEVKTTCNDTALYCTKEFVVDLARKEERLIYGVFISLLLEISKDKDIVNANRSAEYRKRY